MSARISRTDETRRIFFRIERNNQLAPGIDSADVTATVVNPDDSASTTPTVTETSEKPGFYYFDLPSSFLTVVGEYGVVIEVNSTGPNVKKTFDFPVNVSQDDIDALEISLTNVLRSSESRSTHQGTGTWYYVDPVGGNDANAGTSPAQAVQTFAAALTLTVRHDVIYLLKTNASVILTENLVINKEIHVRGPGSGFTIAPSNNALPTIQVTAEHVSLNNFGVQGDPGGSATACIDCSGVAPLFDKLKVFDGNAHGILLSSAVTDFAITNCVVQDHVDTGIRMQSAVRGKIQGGRVFGCDLGIHLQTAAPVSGFVVIDGPYIFNNATTGVLIDVDYAQSVISGLTYFTNNGSAQGGGADPEWDVVNNEPSTKLVANFYTPADKDALFINAADAAVFPLV